MTVDTLVEPQKNVLHTYFAPLQQKRKPRSKMKNLGNRNEKVDLLDKGKKCPGDR